MNQEGGHWNCADSVLPSSSARPLTSSLNQGRPAGYRIDWGWIGGITTPPRRLDVEVSQRGALRRRVGIDQKLSVQIIKIPTSKNLSNNATPRAQSMPTNPQSDTPPPIACPAADRQLNPTFEG